jgi:hypothetical protein
MTKSEPSSGFDLCAAVGGGHKELGFYLFVYNDFGLCQMANRHRNLFTAE